MAEKYVVQVFSKNEMPVFGNLKIGGRGLPKSEQIVEMLEDVLVSNIEEHKYLNNCDMQVIGRSSGKAGGALLRQFKCRVRSGKIIRFSQTL